MKTIQIYYMRLTLLDTWLAYANLWSICLRCWWYILYNV